MVKISSMGIQDSARSNISSGCKCKARWRVKCEWEGSISICGSGVQWVLASHAHNKICPLIVPSPNSRFERKEAKLVNAEDVKSHLLLVLLNS